MEPNNTQITLSDIIFILFRQKWKIILMAILGLIASAGVYMQFPPIYKSDVRLFIRYVEDRTAPITMDGEDRTRKPDTRGDTIINSELQILSSMDLALQVAKKIGPDKILGDPEKRHNDEDAAKLIASNLDRSVPSKSSIISLTFSHKDPGIVRPVLSELVEAYLEKHQVIHHSSSTVDEFTLQQKDHYRNRLARTEEELKQAHAKAGITSLEEAKREQVDSISRIRQALFDAEAELSARLAAIKEAEQLVSNTKGTTDDSTSKTDSGIDQGTIQEYANITSRLDLLHRKEEDMLLRYTSDNVLVRDVREQIRELEAKKNSMENQYKILILADNSVISNSRNGINSTLNLQAERVQAAALSARISRLNQQLALVQSEADKVKAVEIEIQELMRRKEIDEANYRFFSASSEQARINEAFGAGGVRNIGIVQSPSAPIKENEKVKKMMAMVAMGGIGIGLAWAFAIELFLDRSVKRPIEIERKLGIPLFLSIPNARQRSFKKLAKSRNRANLRLMAAAKTKNAKTGEKEGYYPKTPTLIAAAKSRPEVYGTEIEKKESETLILYDETRELKPYYEALRDRMIGYFESRNLTHSPKLIGLTGLGESPGVTTVASGLAKCLSETGEGNVLLVDMTLGQESAQQYYKGSEICDLDQALESQQKAKQKDNLYVVAEGSNGYKVPNILPNRLNHIVPKLKASDFDYIIFDLPEVSPISPTPRLAGFMDAMLMVVEAEKTSIDVVDEATQLLQSSNAHIGAILNKTNSYVPKKLSQQLH